jgi:hypothetical protein
MADLVETYADFPLGTTDATSPPSDPAIPRSSPCSPD